MRVFPFSGAMAPRDCPVPGADWVDCKGGFFFFPLSLLGPEKESLRNRFVTVSIATRPQKMV